MKKIWAYCVVAGVLSGCVDFHPAVDHHWLSNDDPRFEYYKNELDTYKSTHAVDLDNLKPRFHSFIEYYTFFHKHAENLLFYAKDLCQHTTYATGITFHPDNSRQVVHINPLFPVHRSSIRKGDWVLSSEWDLVSDSSLNTLTPPQAITYYSVLEDMEKTENITTLEVCDMHVQVEKQDMLNAMADGHTIYMYPKLHDFLQQDQYMIAVIAHELAHNILSHRHRAVETHTKTQLIVGGVMALAGLLMNDGKLDEDQQNMIKEYSNTAGNLAHLYYSPTLEAEADYVGVYLMARAGYDIENVQDTWKRMSLLGDTDKQFLSTHPSSPERFHALEQTILEIQEKLKTQHRTDLMPNFGNQSLEQIKSHQMAPE